MYEINKAEYTPENFIAGGYPVVMETGVVDTGKTVKKFAPVKMVGGKLQPVVLALPTPAQDYSAPTAAVHTLVIAAAVTANDTITINGEVYTAVASDPVAANKEFVAGTAATAAASLKSAVELVETGFTVAAVNANITFTQKVAGTGDLPTLATSAEGAATISTTTEFAAGNDPLPARTAEENTAAGLYGIAADAAEADQEVAVYLTGEYFSAAMEWPVGVSEAMLKPYFRALGIFLK